MAEDEPKEKALERIVSPENLDKRLVVVSPKGWIALALTALLILGAIGWAIFGEIPNMMQTQAILLNESGFEIIKSHESGVIKDFQIERGKKVHAGDVLGHIASKEKVFPVVAPNPGTVVELFVSNDQNIEQEQSLLLIQKEEGSFYFYSFLSLEKGQQVVKGMKSYIQPISVDTKEYGSIIGEVAYVSPYVVSKERLLELLGDETLIPYFTKNEPVIEVALSPLKNPETASGYAWTSGLGPNEKILPLSIANALIVLQAKKPISYVFPIWRFKKISYEAQQSP